MYSLRFLLSKTSPAMQAGIQIVETLGNAITFPHYCQRMLFPCCTSIVSTLCVTMMRPLILRVVVPLFVLLMSSSNQVLANDAVNDDVPRALAVSEIVTTAACNEIRFDKYRARLDLFYFYTVIFVASDNSVPVDVTGIETAIAHAVATALSGCDDQERPLYAVKLSVTGHALSNGPGLCDTVSLDAATQCRMVRGVTSILLDSDAANAESTAYATIEKVLRDTFFLNQFTMSDLTAAEFVRPIGENLVVMTTPSDETEQSSSSDGKALIAIATASVSFLLTGVFLFGMYRARQNNLARDDSALSPIKARVAHYQAKRRRYFSQLDQAHASDSQQQLEPGWMVTEEADLHHHHRQHQHQQHHHHVSVAPSITWSVSDLTSDSASIRSSNMSHSTRLERIEEVEEEAPSDEFEYDEELGSFTHYDDGDLECPSSSPPIRDDALEYHPNSHSAPPILNVQHEHLDFIAHWNNLVTAIISVQHKAATQDSETCCKDLAVDTKAKEEEEEAATPVRKNRIEEYDATGEDDSGLHGFRFLDESAEEDVHGNDYGKQDVAVDVFDISPWSQHKKSSFTIIRHTIVPSDDAPTDQHQQADYQYDQELQRWYENVLLQLDRALHQKRLE